MAKSGKNLKCSFFLLQNPQWNQRMNSHSVFCIQRCSIFSKIGFAVKITEVNSDVCKIHSNLRSGIFVLFPFTGDYLNLEMFKIFYLLKIRSGTKEWIGMNSHEPCI
jgi:hypothetical protein